MDARRKRECAETKAFPPTRRGRLSVDGPRDPRLGPPEHQVMSPTRELAQQIEAPGMPLRGRAPRLC